MADVGEHAKIVLFLKGFGSRFDRVLSAEELFDVVRHVLRRFDRVLSAEQLPSDRALETALFARVSKIVWDGDPLRVDSFTAPLPTLFDKVFRLHSAIVFQGNKTADAEKYFRSHELPKFDLNRARGALAEETTSSGGTSAGRSLLNLTSCPVQVDLFAGPTKTDQSGVNGMRESQKFTALGVNGMRAEGGDIRRVVVCQGGGGVPVAEWERCHAEHLASDWFVLDVDRRAATQMGMGENGGGERERTAFACVKTFTERAEFLRIETGDRSFGCWWRRIGPIEELGVVVSEEGGENDRGQIVSERTGEARGKKRRWQSGQKEEDDHR